MADGGGGELGENRRHLGHRHVRFRGVVPVVQPDADDFGRARDWRGKLEGGGIELLPAGGIVDPAENPVERIGASRGHFRNGFESGAADSDHLAFGHYTGLVVAHPVERYESQAVPPKIRV